MKRYLRNREGGALVLVILIMMVMTILGFTFISVSLTENKQAIRENNRIEAYYLARSGVEATAAWILRSETTSEQIAQIVNKTGYSDYGSGKFNVEVMKSTDNGDLILVGTGIVNEVSSTTKMILEKSTDTTDDIQFNYLVYAGSFLSASGKVEIDGPIGYGGEVEPNLNGKTANELIIVNDSIKFPTVKVPTSPNEETDKNPDKIIFAGDTNTIVFLNGINSGETIDIITGSGTGEVNIVVNGDFIFGDNHQDRLNIVGDKRVNIYIKGKVTIKGKVNEDNSPQKLLFLMDSSETFHLDTNGTQASFNGFIYAPLATFMSKGNANMQGAIIASAAELSGNPFLSDYKFDPNEDSIILPSSEIYSEGTWID